MHRWIRLLRALSSLNLNISRHGSPTTSLDKLFHYCTILNIKKKIFLISSLNLPSFSQKPFPLVLSQQTPLKSLSSSFLQPPFRYRKAVIMSPQSLLFTRLNSSSSFSLSLQKRCSTTSITQIETKLCDYVLQKKRQQYQSSTRERHRQVSISWMEQLSQFLLA